MRRGTIPNFVLPRLSTLLLLSIVVVLVGLVVRLDHTLSAPEHPTALDGHLRGGSRLAAPLATLLRLNLG
jgi:hypothetical protein